MNVGQNGTCVNAQVKLRVSCAPVNLGIGFTSSCVRDISKDVLTPLAEKECKITWGGGYLSFSISYHFANFSCQSNHIAVNVFFYIYVKIPPKWWSEFSLYISSCLWYDKLILGWEGKITPGHPGDTISPKWVVFQNGLWQRTCCF